MDIRRCATPIQLLHTQKPRKAILAIHGYAGYPGEMALPARLLYEQGFDVFAIRLPGHGTFGKDFNTTRKEDWLGAAEKELLRLQELYEEVSLVGHSMGGTISIILCAKYQIATSVLYAPALTIPKLNHTLISCLAFFNVKLPSGWKADSRYQFFDERDSDDDAFLGKEYWSILYMKQLRQLSLLMKEANRVVGDTTTNFLVLTGKEDATISPLDGKKIVELGKGNNNWIHYEKGTHLIQYDIDDKTRNDAMTATVEWLSV